MKSRQLEINTKCETCCFAITDNNKQIGCLANRLEKFKEQNKVAENENGYYVINRFCNMQRSVTNPVTVESAYNAIKSKFGIAIKFEDDAYSNVAIESCKNIQYDKDKLKISIYSNNKDRFGRLFNEVNEFKKMGINARLFFDIIERNTEDSEKDIFQNLYGYSHLIKLNSNQFINPDFLFNINKSLNDDMEVAFTYEDNNIYCLPFWIVNQQYLNYNNYDNMVEAVVKESINNSMHKKYA